LLLVHQDHRRARYDATGERHPLLLAARQLCCAVQSHCAKVDQIQCIIDFPLDCPPLNARNGRLTFWNTVMCGQIAYD